jgi:hypothetical protein
MKYLPICRGQPRHCRVYVSFNYGKEHCYLHNAPRVLWIDHKHKLKAGMLSDDRLEPPPVKNRWTPCPENFRRSDNRISDKTLLQACITLRKKRGVIYSKAYIIVIPRPNSYLLPIPRYGPLNSGHTYLPSIIWQQGLSRNGPPPLM